MLNASPTAIDYDVYQPRNPKASAYYRCVEDHFEQLETVWDDRYQSRFGFWRAYVTDVIRRYLACGDLHFGFARVKCEDCGYEYLLAYSCKRRHFCPSLAQTWQPDQLLMERFLSNKLKFWPWSGVCRARAGLSPACLA